MSIRKIKVSLESEESKFQETVKALFQDNILKYKEKGETTVILNLEKNTFLRENNQLKLEYQFDTEKETEGKIYSKELNRSVIVTVKTDEIKKEKNDIEIVFEVEEKKFKYHIEVIE